MQQDVDAWEREIAAAARAFTFVLTIQTLDKNPAALKVRLLFGPEFFVRIYINVDTHGRSKPGIGVGAAAVVCA
jgi:hypothetical protein